MIENKIRINNKEYPNIVCYIMKKNEQLTEKSALFSLTTFNEPVEIIEGTKNIDALFGNCTNFNQPIKIPNSVKSAVATFKDCINFNQHITLPNTLKNALSIFYRCRSLDSWKIEFPLGLYFQIIQRLFSMGEPEYNIVYDIKFINNNKIIKITDHDYETKKEIRQFMHEELTERTNLGEMLDASRNIIPLDDRKFALLSLIML